jgi:hypothetical protein
MGLSSRLRKRTMISTREDVVMKPAVALCFSAFMLLSTHSVAAGGTVVCGGVHFIRAAGAEARSTVISLRNLNLVTAATVERITVRNAYGQIVHDSGPAAGTLHPANTDFSPALDITVVPPGASYYLATSHIWPSGELPDPQTGQNLAVSVQFSTVDNPALFVVEANSRTRETESPRAERARDSNQCTRLK